jgi:hypothetical protein
MWHLVVGEFIREIVLPGTNLNRQQKNLAPVTEEDIQRYMCFLDVCRVDKKPELKHYFMGEGNPMWSWLGCPYARHLMEGTSLEGPVEQRFWSLHTTVKFDHIEASRWLSAKFQSLVNIPAGAWTTVDERLFPGLWRCSFIVFLPKKPHGDKGLNIWILALVGGSASADYVLCFFLKEGEDTDGPAGYEDVLVHLSRDLPQDTAAVTADQRFSTVTGALRLDAGRHPFMLHIKPNWAPQLAGILRKKTPRLGSCACIQHKDTGVVMATFHDVAKHIFFLTNMFNAASLGTSANAPLYLSQRAEERSQQEDLDPEQDSYIAGPLFRQSWNKGARAVDGTNRDAFTYEFRRRTKSWKKAYRSHILCGIALPQVSALFNMHRAQNGLGPRMQQLHIIRDCCFALFPPPPPPHPLQLPRAGRPRVQHLPVNAQDYEEEFGEELPQGVADTPRTCKFKGCKTGSKTPYVCDTCWENFHPGACFRKHHLELE